MGRKKRKGTDSRPFCFYCDREFDDEKVLIQHQKAKHFRCEQCNRKLDTAQGLSVHLVQVHKINMKKVPNSLNGRDDPELIIYGMAGVPQNLIFDKNDKIKGKTDLQYTQKQQRLQWAQVASAPSSFEQYVQNLQQTNNQTSTNNNNSFMRVMPGIVFPTPNMMTNPMGSMPHQTNNAQQSRNTLTSHTITEGPTMFTNPMMSPSLAPPGTSPIGTHPQTEIDFPSQSTTHIGHDSTTWRPPPPIHTHPNQLKFPTHITDQSSTHTHTVTPSSVFANVGGPTTSAPMMPANMKLYYDDNFVSIEEKRAMKEYGYHP